MVTLLLECSSPVCCLREKVWSEKALLELPLQERAVREASSPLRGQPSNPDGRPGPPRTVSMMDPEPQGPDTPL